MNEELVIIDYLCQREVKPVQLAANFEFEADDREQNSCQLVVKSSRFFKRSANFLGIKVASRVLSKQLCLFPWFLRAAFDHRFTRTSWICS